MIQLTYQQTPLYHFDLLQKQTNLKHYVSGRKGGVSVGDFDSLNISFNTADDADNVQHNRNRIAQALHIENHQLIFARQTHGDDILTIDDDFLALPSEEKQAVLLGKDALISQKSGFCLCITAADCVPILLYDPINKAVGAVHAGWRGTAQRILAKTVQAMQNAFGTKPKDLLAGIGPSISGDVYEVGPEVIVAIEKAMGSTEGLVHLTKAQTGQGLLDLWETNQRQMLETGLHPSNIEIAGICTYTQHQDFFSARRFNGKGGRFSAGIILEAV